MSSGRGESPHRRYSPRAICMIRCNSGADSIVWMEEDGIFCDAWLWNSIIPELFVFKDILRKIVLRKDILPKNIFCPVDYRDS